MIVRMYQKGDFDAIEDCVEPMGRPSSEDVILESSVSMTVEDDGIPVVCGGVVYDTESNGIVWLKLSEKASHKMVKIMRLIDAGFRIITESFGFDTITARVNEKFKVGHKFAMRFGFIPTDETVKIFSDTYRTYKL